MRYLHLLLVTVFLSGCAVPPVSTRTYSRPAQVEATRALVIIYRPDHKQGSITSPYILIDGKTVVDLPNKSFFPVSVTPGSHVITTKKKYVGQKEWAKPATFSFDAGQTYYVRFYPERDARSSMVFGPTPMVVDDAAYIDHVFTVVPRNIAEMDLSGLHEADPIEVTKKK